MRPVTLEQRIYFSLKINQRIVIIAKWETALVEIRDGT